MMRHALTIAGSDSCGGAGIQADLKTFSALGVYAMSVVTAVTAQNTTGVLDVRDMDEKIVRGQIDAIFEDIRVDAVKIGMVSSGEIIRTIAAGLREHQAKNIVVDPVMVSKSGCHLLKPEATSELINLLLPLAQLVTPNLYEAEMITGQRIEDLGQMEWAAREILSMGARAVVVKGGHLTGDAVDVFYDGSSMVHLPGKRLDTRNTHGTGCTFSSAIAAYLAQDCPLLDSVRKAKVYITGAIENSFPLGHGVGPTNHFFDLYEKAGVTAWTGR